MAKLLRFLGHKTDGHLSDGQLVAAIDADYPKPLPASCVRHLERCWSCLARKQQLQDTIFKVVEYQLGVVAPFLPPPPSEAKFVALLDAQIEAGATRWWERFPHRFSSLRVAMNPVLASVLVVLFAIGALFLIWNGKQTTVSSGEFLQKAEVSDENTGGSPAIVYQRIQIRAGKRTYERMIYRDAQKRRRLKESRLDAENETLKEKLATAGVSWNEPLSAESFMNWHDSQLEKRDEMAPSRDGLMTLKTSLQKGEVARESLTVRKRDYHPVARSVEFRDKETVEIAELDYAVLGWNDVNDSMFEPIASDPNLSRPTLAPSLPSKQQLDETELCARLVLNDVGVDSAEPLKFSRSSKAVQISGMVESEQRKKELLAQLRSIPHLTLSIFSLEELNATGVPKQTSVYSIQRSADSSEPSPLETLLRQHNKSPEEITRSSQELLDNAIGAQRESSALNELLQRFPLGASLSDSGWASLNELLQRHSNKLSEALSAEEQTIRLLDGSQARPIPSHGDEGPQSLTVAAARNRQLCTELITRSQPSPRTAEAIISDILASIEDVRRSRNSRLAFARIEPGKFRPEKP